MAERILLTIAGTDPCQGAGVGVDLQVFRDFGFHGACAISAVVAQNTTGVRRFDPIRPGLLRDQLEAIADDLPIAGVKIGMLPTAESVEVVAAFFDEHAARLRGPLIIDPVLASGRGEAALSAPGAATALLDTLIPRADVVTPNLPELQRLVGRPIHSRDDAEDAAIALLASGCRAVLFKSGHMQPDGESIQDLWVCDDGSPARWLAPLKRAPGDVRGTGCQLSSALCAASADGTSLEPAAERARLYLNEMLHERARMIGRGSSVIVRAADPFAPDPEASP